MTCQPSTCDLDPGHTSACQWNGIEHPKPPPTDPQKVANGWLAAHHCGWERYTHRRQPADKALHEHKQRCKETGP